MMTETPELLPTLFKLTPREGGYALVTAPDYSGFSFMLSPDENDVALNAAFVAFLAVSNAARVPPSTVGSGAALVALLTWCQIERGKFGALDGYDYKSGEEYGIRRVELQIERAIASEKEGDKAGLAAIQVAADEVVSRVAEWDDRTSPEDFPEALLITPSELHRELVRFATDTGMLVSPAVSLIAKGEAPELDGGQEPDEARGGTTALPHQRTPTDRLGHLARTPDNSDRLAPSRPPLPEGEAVAWREASPDDIRALGWTVAVHNDYRIGGKSCTFWLFVRNGIAIKGEGPTDADALNEVRRALASPPPASASAIEANVVAGARAIAAAHGHDPDALAPRTEMCGADNLQVPWWKVFEEEAEACLKAAAPASAGVIKAADELHDLGFNAGWNGAIEECAQMLDDEGSGTYAEKVRVLASGEKK